MPAVRAYWGAYWGHIGDSHVYDNITALSVAGARAGFPYCGSNCRDTDFDCSPDDGTCVQVRFHAHARNVGNRDKPAPGRAVTFQAGKQSGPRGSRPFGVRSTWLASGVLIW